MMIDRKDYRKLLCLLLIRLGSTLNSTCALLINKGAWRYANKNAKTATKNGIGDKPVTYFTLFCADNSPSHKHVGSNLPNMTRDR